MQSAKLPETEVEYWTEIECLGGMIFQMRHDLNHGRIDDPNGLIAQSVKDMYQRQEELVGELSEKFGVILPADCPKVASAGEELPPAPEGKIRYWDWYDKLAREASLMEYQQLLCSACPFSAGLDDFIPNWQVTCKFNDKYPREYRSHHIYLCFKEKHATDFGGIPVTMSDIHAKILTEYGQETLDIFKAKEAEVKSKFSDDHLA